MINFNKAELRDKIYACWIGKNIGGSTGTPYEDGCFHVMNDCTGFQCEPGNPFPNDDLDLQLIGLLAMAENGPDAVNSQLLGEYRLEYVTPYWSEYVISKTNMEKGMLSLLAGQYKNNTHMRIRELTMVTEMVLMLLFLWRQWRQPLM